MKKIRYSEKYPEYLRLSEMEESEKYLDSYISMDDEIYSNFREMILFEMNKKIEPENYLHKDLVEKILSKRPLESGPEKQEKTPLRRRTLEQLFSKFYIINNSRILSDPKEISNFFPNKIAFYPKDIIDYNSEGLEEFFNCHEQVDFMNFIIENFGYDFQSKIFRIRNYDSCEDSSWEEFSGDINYGRLIIHTTNQRIIQAKQYKHTKILKVEVDTRKNDENLKHYLTPSEMMNIVSHEFGIQPFYVERSLKKRGVFRAFFLFDSYLNDLSKIKIEKYFNSTYKFKIFIQKSEDYMTLPFSKEVLLHGRFDENHPMGIIPETLTKTYNRITSGVMPGKIRSIENLIGKIQYGKVIGFEDCLNRSENGSTPYNEGYKKFSYGAGTRHVNQVKLAVWSKGHMLTFNQYESLAYELDCGSKDMYNWGTNRIRQQLSRYWDFAERVANPVNTEKTYYLSDDGKKVYSIKDLDCYTSLDEKDVKDKFLAIVNFYYNQKFTSKRQQGQWKTYFLKDSLKFYRFLQRKKNYNEIIGRRYKDTKYSPLDEGVLFPVSIYKDIKNFLNLKTSLEKIINFFREFELLKCVNIDNREFSYKNKNFARHYILITDIEITHIYNSIFNISNIYSSFSSINYSSHVCFGKDLNHSIRDIKNINFSPPP